MVAGAHPRRSAKTVYGRFGTNGVDQATNQARFHGNRAWAVLRVPRSRPEDGVSSDSGRGGPGVTAGIGADRKMDIGVAWCGAETHRLGGRIGVHSNLDQLVLGNSLAEVVAASTVSVRFIHHAQLLASQVVRGGVLAS